MKSSFLTSSPEETEALGRDFAGSLEKGAVVALFGVLGSGKTTFLKGAISSLIKCQPEEVTSPTFNYLHIFETAPFPVYHFDLYRLNSQKEFEKNGFFDYLNPTYFSEGFYFFEWAEKIQEKLPSKTIIIHISYEGLDQRLIFIEQ